LWYALGEVLHEVCCGSFRNVGKIETPLLFQENGTSVKNMQDTEGEAVASTSKEEEKGKCTPQSGLQRALENQVSDYKGRVMAQAVSRWLLTAAAQVRSQILSSEICGGQSGAGAGFLRVL
jgi:hypothetical protein